MLGANPMQQSTTARRPRGNVSSGASVSWTRSSSRGRPSLKVAAAKAVTETPVEGNDRAGRWHRLQGQPWPVRPRTSVCWTAADRAATDRTADDRAASERDTTYRGATYHGWRSAAVHRPQRHPAAGRHGPAGRRPDPGGGDPPPGPPRPALACNQRAALTMAGGRPLALAVAGGGRGERGRVHLHLGAWSRFRAGTGAVFLPGFRLGLLEDG
jgi:hypothetical protein